DGANQERHVERETNPSAPPYGKLLVSEDRAMAIESVTRVTVRTNERRWTQWRREALDERHDGWPWEEMKAAVREEGRYEAKVCLVSQGLGSEPPTRSRSWKISAAP